MMAVWRRTDPYEYSTLDAERGEERYVSPLDDALVSLWERMLLALTQVYLRLDKYQPEIILSRGRNDLMKRLASYESLMGELRILEEAVHARAAQYMQWKQVAMLQEVRWEQDVMKKKIDYLVRARKSDVEEKYSRDAPETWKDVWNGVMGNDEIPKEDAEVKG